MWCRPYTRRDTRRNGMLLFRSQEHSPTLSDRLMSPAGRLKEDAQKWGTHVSLTTPVLRQCRSEYYQIAHSESLPMEERVFLSTPWSVSSADSITRQSVPSEVRVKMTQLHDWEMLARASLGVVNHLDWFLGSVGRIVASVD